jgi:hypothetical protein
MPDQPKLYLRVVGQSRGWVQQYTMNGKAYEMGLGSTALSELS